VVVGIRRDALALVAVAEERAVATQPAIEVARVAHLDVVHGRVEAALRAPREQVVVVDDEHALVRFQVARARRMREAGLEVAVVFPREKESALGDGSVEYVVPSTRFV